MLGIALDLEIKSETEKVTYYTLQLVYHMQVRLNRAHVVWIIDIISSSTNDSKSIDSFFFQKSTVALGDCKKKML